LTKLKDAKKEEKPDVIAEERISRDIYYATIYIKIILIGVGGDI